MLTESSPELQQSRTAPFYKGETARNGVLISVSILFNPWSLALLMESHGENRRTLMGTLAGDNIGTLVVRIAVD